jgi:hypothetical protein
MLAQFLTTPATPLRFSTHPSVRAAAARRARAVRLAPREGTAASSTEGPASMQGASSTQAQRTAAATLRAMLETWV